MAEKKSAPKKNGFVSMTNEDLIRIVSAGGLQTLNNRELPAKPTYWIGVITDKIESAWRSYGAARDKLIKQFAKKDDRGNVLYTDDKKTLADIPAEDLEAFQEELKVLGEQVIEIPMAKRDMTLLSLAEELEEKGISLKPLELRALRPFYQE
jgi:hypothetical protein